MIEAAQRDETDFTRSREIRSSDDLPSHFREFCPVDSWAPAVNLYELRSQLVICVDLAGVKPGSIEVQVDVGRLMIRGVRAAPQPPTRSHDVVYIVAMEIDHGPFCRTVSLPKQVDHMRVQVQYSQGLLWVRLPLRRSE